MQGKKNPEKNRNPHDYLKKISVPLVFLKLFYNHNCEGCPAAKGYNKRYFKANYKHITYCLFWKIKTSVILHMYYYELKERKCANKKYCLEHKEEFMENKKEIALPKGLKIKKDEDDPYWNLP